MAMDTDSWLIWFKYSDIDLNFIYVNNFKLGMDLKAKAKSFYILDMDMLISKLTNLVTYPKSAMRWLHTIILLPFNSYDVH